METVKVRALRSFAENVPGRGMIVLNGPVQADKERGVEARDGGEGELPLNVAMERAARGHVEIVGKGAGIKTRTAADIREARMKAREEAKAMVALDGPRLRAFDEDEDTDGDPVLASDVYREAYEASDPKPLEGATYTFADGNGIQYPGETRTGTASDVDGEDAVVNPDEVGDGVSGKWGVFDPDGDGQPGGSLKGEESNVAKGRRKRSGGKAASETDAPVE